MGAQLTIIGLGQIGASFGMALKGQKNSVKRVGCDKDIGRAKAAQTLEAVDQISKLQDAVKDAAVVLVCVPLGELREILRQIGPRLKEGAVVMETAPAKHAVAEWAGEFIPEGCFYLGLVPVLNPAVLAAPETGLNAARPDLFNRSVMVVDALPGTPEAVVRLAFDLSRLVGAKPMLTDMTESDGLMASIHLLPQLTAAALLHATVDQPGWAEARKLAGRPYTSMTGGIAYYDDPQSLRTAALSNRTSLVHSLDVLLASLKGLRDDIDQGNDQGLADRLDQAYEARESWLNERNAAGWLKEGGEVEEVPNLGDHMMQMFFGSTILGRTKKKK